MIIKISYELPLRARDNATFTRFSTVEKPPIRFLFDLTQERIIISFSCPYNGLKVISVIFVYFSLVGLKLSLDFLHH